MPRASYVKSVLASFVDKTGSPESERLLKLYWNRAAVKRELTALRKERYELLDRIKQQESAVVRAQDQLNGLEKLLTNPVAAANAMVYFQFRHLWRFSAQRVAQFAEELRSQRSKRENEELRAKAKAKQARRLAGVRQTLGEVTTRRQALMTELEALLVKQAEMNAILRLFVGRGLKRQQTELETELEGLRVQREELEDLADKIAHEPPPNHPGMSLENRRIVNTAIIAFAQFLVLHFLEHDLASLAKSCRDKPVSDMKFGDRRDCDRLVDRIRERIEEVSTNDKVAALVQLRAKGLAGHLTYKKESDAVPNFDSVAFISPDQGQTPGRRASDAPVEINVLASDYWDISRALA